MPKPSDVLKSVASTLSAAAAEMENLEAQIDENADRIAELKNELEKERRFRRGLLALLQEYDN